MSKKDELHTPTPGATVGPMIDIATLPTAVQAALVVTLVLIEAIVLYAGYGMIEERIAPPVLEIIEDI